MEFKINNNCISFFGVLNENTKAEEIKSAMQTVLANNANLIDIDLSGITRANSSGIRTLINVFDETKPCGHYVHTPEWFVEQINLVMELNFCNMFVKTLDVHFYCPQNDTYHDLTIEVGKELPLLESYDDFEFNLVSPDGLPLEPDFEIPVYFVFLTKMADKYRKHFA